MAVLFWLVSLLFMLSVQPVLAQNVAQDELQIAVRRYMQCQADNVGMYNVQVQLSQSKIAELQNALDAVKKELANLKALKDTR